MKILKSITSAFSRSRKGSGVTNDELKSLSFESFNSGLFALPGLCSLLQSRGHFDLAAWQALRFYMSVPQISTSVDIISQEIESIQPLVFDKETDEFTDNSQILDFLTHPNADVTYPEFIFSVAAFYLITGEAFLVATGRPDRPPLEMFVVSPVCVTEKVGTNGFVSEYKIRCSSSQTLTFRAKEVNSRLRFFTANGDQELYHIRNFNPLMGNHCVRGVSKLSSIYFEIEQYVNSAVHNTALLVNSAKPSALFSLKSVGDGGPTREQFDRLKMLISENMSGPENSGRVALIPAAVESVSLTMNNTDMDFENMQKRLDSTIYNRMRIPLPMVLPDQMTLANLEAASLSLYDNAVIPLQNKLMMELTDFLMHRFDDSGNLSLSYNQEAIPALQIRRNQQIKMKAELNILTDNQLLTLIGAPTRSGGDVIYKSGNLVAVQVGESTGDNVDEVEQEDLKSVYMQRLRSIKNHAGEKIFTDEKISELTSRYMKG